MPRGDYPIFTGNAGVSCPWADAFVGGGMQVTLAAEIERGINLEVGANIFANIDASLRKFIAINFEAEAYASAGITAQIQAPMNIFREVGVAVRLEAVAEAAAGAELTIGLNAADFIALVESDSRMNGLPTQLFMIFMDEVSIGAGAYAKAAVSAMAYADIIVAGTLIKHGLREPGFTITAEAGVGVEVGAGFRVCANLGIADPRRFIMRSIDLAVDELILQISELLPNDLEMEKQLLNAFRAPAKIALRNAYEIGHMLSTKSIATDAAGDNQLAMRCVQVVLEESQRYLLDTLVSTGLEMFEEMIQSSRFGMTDDKWNEIRSQREALANQLLAMPENRRLS